MNTLSPLALCLANAPPQPSSTSSKCAPIARIFKSNAPQQIGCSLRPAVEQGVDHRKIGNKLAELLRVIRMPELLPDPLDAAPIERSLVVVASGANSRQIARAANRSDDPRHHFAPAS